jgi:hypothetical protein
MALQAFPLAPASAGSLIEITPKNTHRYPAPITAAMLAPAYTPVTTYTGGAYGDDVSLATANSTVPILPNTQATRATFPGVPNSVVPSESIASGQAITNIADYTFATDITAPRGYIGPKDPYSTPAPPAPTITSLSPNTAVAGSASPLAVTITGTGFTQWSTVLTGNVETPYVTYFSPTKIVILMDPKRSIAGTISVIVRDHSVNSAASNFTFT